MDNLYKRFINFPCNTYRSINLTSHGTVKLVNPSVIRGTDIDEGPLCLLGGGTVLGNRTLGNDPRQKSFRKVYVDSYSTILRVPCYYKLYKEIVVTYIKN